MKVDMSPQAVRSRLRTMDDLWLLSVKLMNAKKSKGTKSHEEAKKLGEEFRRAAIEKEDFAREERDHRLYEVMRKSFHQLKALGTAGEKELSALLMDESVHVRQWIASALMVEGNPNARSVLEEIAEGKGHAGFNAKITLEEFDKGRLTTVFPVTK